MNSGATAAPAATATPARFGQAAAAPALAVGGVLWCVASLVGGSDGTARFYEVLALTLGVVQDDLLPVAAATSLDGPPVASLTGWGLVLIALAAAAKRNGYPKEPLLRR